MWYYTMGCRDGLTTLSKIRRNRSECSSRVRFRVRFRVRVRFINAIGVIRVITIIPSDSDNISNLSNHIHSENLAQRYSTKMSRNIEIIVKKNM